MQKILTWVGNNKQLAVGAVLDDIGNDELEDVYIPLDQIQTALSLLLPRPSCDDHQLGVGSHAVV